MLEENKTSKSNEEVFKSMYDDTIYFVDSIVNDYDIFKVILEKMKNGNASVELKKRYLLRAIDETWVNIIEDTLPALDEIIRNPSKFIEDKEELVGIEMAKKVTPRALQHLSQHTNLIQRIEGDTIIPAKLLNVFKEETFQTYENKFVNTLLNRLYLFVHRRYEIAKRDGQDEKTTSLTFNEQFNHNDVRVRFNMKIELAEDSQEGDKVERNYSYTSDLWHRVEKLNSIVTEYATSEFTEIMGKSFIRPPVMKTNAILKNKNLHQCLLLWQFIESYEGAGYSMLIQENLEDIDEGYLKELYSTLALQYMIFRYNIKNEFEVDNTIASQLTDDEIRPRIVDELTKIQPSEFDIKDEKPERLSEHKNKVRYNTLTPEDRLIEESLDVALQAAFIINGNGDWIIYSGGDVKEPEPEKDEPRFETIKNDEDSYERKADESENEDFDESLEETEETEDDAENVDTEVVSKEDEINEETESETLENEQTETGESTVTEDDDNAFDVKSNEEEEVDSKEKIDNITPDNTNENEESSNEVSYINNEDEKEIDDNNELNDVEKINGEE